MAAYSVSFQSAGEKRVYISSHELVNEVSDDKRFPKKVTAGLNEVRNGTGDGLFTVSRTYALLRGDGGVDRAMYRRLEGRRNTTGVLPVRLHLPVRTIRPRSDGWVTDRLLMPCFGTASIYNMFDDMMDIVHQLVLKWERRVP